jgi:hypothetical protein
MGVIEAHHDYRCDCAGGCFDTSTDKVNLLFCRVSRECTDLEDVVGGVFPSGDCDVDV